MEKQFYKYADLLINRCLCIKKNQPLLITAPLETIDFVRIVAKVAYEAGVKEIYFDFEDDILKHDQLKYLNNKELLNSKFFNKSIYDEYAKKKAAFLILYANDPDIMFDIDKDKIAYTAKINKTTRPIYKKLQLSYKVPWCIAGVVTKSWAKKVLPNSPDPYTDLWNIIFKLTLTNIKDPIEAWNNKIKANKEIVTKLNKMKINKLIYKNNLGTNFEIGFKNNVWCGVGEHTTDGKSILVNMPSEEVFTVPDKYTANGIVYASKPLVYNGSIINNFWIEFKDGKVINYDAKEGKDILKSIIETENGNYLGEVALVDKNSPIAKSNLLFYETLYDENASCHLALGAGYPDCLKAKAKKEDSGFNESETHVDFMIGTDDLKIIAITKDNNEIVIMEKGLYKI